MNANPSNFDRLVSVRENVKAELAQAEENLIDASKEITRSIGGDDSETYLNLAIRRRGNLLELRNQLRRANSILNESDTLSFIIPNLICMDRESKVSTQTLRIICELLD